MLQKDVLSWEKSVSISPTLFYGAPYIRGTDIPLYKILLFLSKNLSLKELKKEYPQLSNKDIYSALACAAHAFQWEVNNGEGTGEGI